MPRLSKAPPASAFTGSGWNPDIVFATLADLVRRRHLCAPAPSVPLETTETGRCFNFGCCIVPAGA